MSPPRRARWLSARNVLAALVSYVLFCTHFARDSLGALELPLEDARSGVGMTPRQFNALTTAYFLPNCFMPLVGGVLAQRNGPAAYIFFLRIALLGNCFVAAAALVAHAIGSAPSHAHSEVPFTLLLFGRTIMGVAYETSDMIGPLTFIAPRFTDKFATVIGVVNGINRLGSVLNFLLCGHLPETIPL